MRRAGRRVASILCAIGVAAICIPLTVVLLTNDRSLQYAFVSWLLTTFTVLWCGWFIYLPALGLFEWLLHRYQPQTVWQMSGLGSVATLTLEVPVLLLSYPFFGSFFLDLLMLVVSGATYGFLHYSWIAAEQSDS